MAPGDQELNINAKVTGGDKAAQELSKVEAARKKVVDGDKEALAPTKELNEEQKKLTASESDFIGVLNAIDPALGRYTDALLKSFKVGGDLASQQINLKSLFGKATTAIKKNAAALKLIGAGGAVVVGLLAIAAAIKKIREETERNNRALEEQAQRLGKLKDDQETRKASLERISAQRAEGPFTAEESTIAARVLERLRRDLPDLSPTSRQQAVVAGGSGSSIERLRKIAIFIESFADSLNFNPNDLIARKPDERNRIIDQALGVRSKQIETVQTRETQQRQIELVREALAEVRRGKGASTSAIRGFIESLPGQIANTTDVDLLARAVQGLASIPDNVQIPRILPHENRDFVRLSHKVDLLSGAGIEGLRPEIVRIGEEVLNLLRNMDRKLEESGGNVTNNNQGSTFVSPGGNRFIDYGGKRMRRGER